MDVAKGELLVYQTDDGQVKIDVRLEDETIWLTQQHKSTHVARQALQALVYQVAAAVIGLLAWCCWGVLWLLMLIASIGSGATADPPAAVWVGLALMIIPAGIMGLTVLYGLWGAVRSLNGHDFKYAIIGNWLETL